MAKRLTAAEKLKNWLDSNRAKYATNASFADAAEISEGRLSQILAGQIPSPKLAVRIEAATSQQIRSSVWFENLSKIEAR